MNKELIKLAYKLGVKKAVYDFEKQSAAVPVPRIGTGGLSWTMLKNIFGRAPGKARRFWQLLKGGDPKITRSYKQYINETRDNLRQGGDSLLEANRKLNVIRSGARSGALSGFGGDNLAKELAKVDAARFAAGAAGLGGLYGGYKLLSGDKQPQPQFYQAPLPAYGDPRLLYPLTMGSLGYSAR